MSYCRWSCMDFGCDVYAYESDYGYEIHLANRRVVGDVPHVPNILEVDPEVWAAAHHAQHEYLKTAAREAIDLPEAGQSFTCGDLEDFRAKMVELRNMGYRFPDWVFDEIDAEMQMEAL